MSGDWIPYRVALKRDPAVFGIAARLGVDDRLVVFALLELWAFADEQSTDGEVRNVSAGWIDGLVRLPGFAEACAAEGWLELLDGAGFRIPKFERWMGSSAKARLRDTALKRRVRAGAQPDTDPDECPDPIRTNVRTPTGPQDRTGEERTEQDRRSQKKSPTPTRPRREIGEAIEEIAGILAEAPRNGTAADFHGEVERSLDAAGWSVKREVIVPDRGDGYRGKLDLVAERGGVRAAIECDASNPREKSVTKLLKAPCDVRVVALRTGRTQSPPEGIDLVCGTQAGNVGGPPGKDPFGGVEIPQELNCTRFRTAWEAYTAMRREYRYPRWKPQTIARNLRACADAGLEPTLEELDRATRACWRSIHPKRKRLPRNEKGAWLNEIEIDWTDRR